MRTDTERLDFLDKWEQQGAGLVSDDNGHWALSGSGMQSVPEGTEPEFISTCFDVEKHEWFSTVREAIDSWMDAE